MKSKTDRIQIEYDLQFATLFHCGTGIREALVDRTVVRDNEGYLYVPGSTFKGVLRECCEHLARFYEEDGQETQLVQSPHNREAALWELGNNKPSMVTRIFGSQSSPGRIFFDDARQDENDLKQYDSPEHDGKGKYKSFQVDLYTQVRLDRSTRTAVPGALYTSEFGLNDLTFKGTIQGWLECIAIDSNIYLGTEHSDNVPTYSLLLLLAGMCMVERLGGNKSTGKGKCRCEITRVILNGKEYVGEEWKSWLQLLDELTYYNMSQEGSA